MKKTKKILVMFGALPALFAKTVSAINLEPKNYDEARTAIDGYLKEQLYPLLTYLAMIAAIVVIAWNGIKMALNSGDAHKRAEHMFAILFALGGFIIALTARVIVALVTPK